jgi:heme-degrading monooxygenase HmoA
MFLTTRTVQTLPGQQLAFVDAWISAAAHPLKHQPGFKHVYVLASPDTPDTVIIQFVWEQPDHMEAWVASAAHQRVQERVAPFWQASPTRADYTLYFEQCACSHHYNLDAVEEPVEPLVG